MTVKKNVKINKPPILFRKTQQIITALEKKLNGALLTYWNSSSGSICHNDVVGFNEVLKALNKKKQLFLFIKSDGGNGTASLRIVNMLRQYTKQITALVPLECASAATMLTLGANEIRMGPLAYLSAVDTSLTHDLSPVDKDNDLVSVSQNEVSRIVNLWKLESRKGDTVNPFQTIFNYIHPLVIGAVDRASSLSFRLCMEILSYHMDDEEKAEAISNTLNSDYPAHAYPITLKEAKRIGLNAHDLDPEVNEMLIELNEVYSEMGQRARTDYDEFNHHNNEILNILEGKNIQLFYQNDKDWHYRKEERRWITMNDNSSWHRIENVNGKMVESVFHVR